MSINELRAELPDWQWRAERNGMAWRYVGTNGIRVAVVSEFAVLVGEDDFASQWRVDCDGVLQDYASFWLREQSAGIEVDG